MFDWGQSRPSSRNHRIVHLRFAPESGQMADLSICPLGAKTGLKLRRGCTPSASRERLRLRPGGLRFVCRSISRPPPYAGRLVDAACWSDGLSLACHSIQMLLDHAQVDPEPMQVEL